MAEEPLTFAEVPIGTLDYLKITATAGDTVQFDGTNWVNTASGGSETKVLVLNDAGSSAILPITNNYANIYKKISQDKLFFSTLGGGEVELTNPSTAITALPSLTSIQGQTISSSKWPFLANMNQNVSSGSSPTFVTVSATNLVGELATAAQPNITSVGSLSSLEVKGNTLFKNAAGTTLINFNTSSGAATFSVPITVNNDLIINGDIYYNSIIGIRTTSAQIKLADENMTNAVDFGFYGQYSLDGGATTSYAGLFRSATTQRWVLYKNLTTDPTNPMPGSYSNADLVLENLYSTNLYGTVSTAAQTGITSLANLASIQGQAIGGTVWPYVATMNQSVASGASPTFVTLNATTVSATSLGGALTTLSQPITTLPDLVSIQGQTISYSKWPFVANMNQNVSSGSSPTFVTVSATNFVGEITTAAQLNITSVGTLTGLTVSGNFVVNTGGITLTNNSFYYGGSNTIGIFTASPQATGANTSGVVHLKSNGSDKFSQLIVSDSINSNFFTVLSGRTSDEATYLINKRRVGDNPELIVSSWDSYGGTPVERYRITGDGNMLIGATSNASGRKLLVNGAIEGMNIYGTVATAAQTGITTLANLVSIQGQTLSSSVWPYVSVLNQNLATSSSPTFAKLTLGATSSLQSAINIQFTPGAINYITQYAKTDNTLRWAWSITGSEAGSEAGSSLSLSGYNDAGSSATVMMTLSRLGVVYFPNGLLEINSVSLPSTVWQYVATMNQSVASGASPTFVTLGVTTLNATTVNGIIGTAAQANITSVGTLTSLAVNGNTTVSSGRLAVPVGSVSAPSIYFTGSTGSGLYSESGDIINITTNSNKALVIDYANGHVLRSSVSDGALLVEDARAAAIGRGAVVNLAGSTSTSTLTGTTFARLKSGKTNGTDADANAYLAFLTLNAGTLTESFRIDDTQNIIVNSKNLSGVGTLSTGVLSATTIQGAITTASQANITTLGGLTSIQGVSGINTTKVTYWVDMDQKVSTGSSPTFAGLTISSGLVFPAGSVSAPSLYFSTDTTSGFYRVSANQIGITISGSNVSTWSSTGLSMTGGINMNSGNITSVGTLTASSLGGTLSTAAQPNITSIGELTDLTVSSASAPTSLFNDTTPVTVDVGASLGLRGYTSTGVYTEFFRIKSGKTNLTVGNLSGYASFSTSNAGTLTESFRINNLQNIIVNNKNITGVADFSATNVTGTNLYGSLGTASQTGITAIGTLSSLVMGGNITLNTNNINTVGVLGVVTVNATTVNCTTVTATNLGGTLTTVSQPNVTTMAGLVSIASTGNTITLAANAIASTVWPFVAAMNQSVASSASPTFVTVNCTTVTATNLGGTLSTASQPNVTSAAGLVTIAATNSTVTIAATALASTVWPFVAAMNQSVANNASPTFATVNCTTVTATNLGGTLSTASQPNVTTMAGLVSIASINNTVTIAATAIASTVWPFVAAMNQSVASGASPTFVTVNCTTVTATNLGGTLSTAAQANITSVGTLTSLTMGGAINLATNNITNGGTITATTLAGTLSTVTQNSITTMTAVSTLGATATALSIPSTSITISGVAISATQFGYLGSLNQSVATGASPTFITVNCTTVGCTTVTATNLGGTLSTAAQPNITSAAGLVTIAATGNTVTIAATALASTVWPFVAAMNQSVASGASPTFVTVNCTTVTATNLGGTLSTAAQPNITSAAGLVTIASTGNTVTIAATALASTVWPFVAAMNQSVANNASPTFVTVNCTTVTATNLGGTLSTAAQPNITSAAGLVTIASTGNTVTIAATALASTVWTYVATMNQSVANNASPTFVTVTAALSGNATTATTAGTVTTAAQPSITSVGTLTSLTTSGVITGSNGLVGTPSLNLGDSTTGWYRSALNNISVSIAGSRVATWSSTGLAMNSLAISGVSTLTATTLGGTLSTAAQASVTSLGTLTSLAVSSTIGTGISISGFQAALAISTITGLRINGTCYYNGTCNNAEGIFINYGFSTPATGNTIAVGAGIRIYNNTTAMSGTLSNLYGVLIQSGTSLGPGTCALSYGLYVTQQAAGTTKIAAYMDNLAVGYTAVAPPSDGAIISGTLSVGTSASGTYGSHKLYIVGTSFFSGAVTTSGVITASNGAVGAPSINLGDSTTGWYRFGANSLAVAISGAAKMIINSSGNMTLGATDLASTTNTLYVNGNARLGGTVIGAFNGNTSLGVTGAFTTYTNGYGYGIQCAPTFSASQASTEFRSLNVESVFSAGGSTLTNAIGANVYNNMGSNSGTISNAIGLFVSAGSGGAGTINNAYGAYITEPAHGTNRYATYISGGLTINPVTSNSTYAILLTGNLVPLSSSYNYSFIANCTIKPTSSSTGCRGISSQTGFWALSGQTMTEASGIFISNTFSSNQGIITNAYGLLVNSGSAGASTITNSFGIYCTTPAHGTTKIATYTDNLSVGYTGVEPPTNGAMINGTVSIGASSGYGSDKLYVLGSVTSGSHVIKDPSATLDLKATQAAGAPQIRFYSNAQTSTGWSLYGSASSAGSLTIQSNSAYLFVGYGGTSWQAGSDSRIKKNIENYTDSALALINSMVLKKYHMIDEKDETTTKKIGFIAQDFLAIVPELVGSNTNKEGVERYGIAYGDLTKYLVKAVQELSVLVTSQAAKIAALEN